MDADDASEPVLELRFSNSPSAIEDSCAAVVRFLEPFGLSARTLHRAEVILEELVSNLVRHGEGVRELRVIAAVRDGVVGLVVEDDGAPFNPFDHPEPQPFTRLQDAELGGLGILLVTRFSSATSYERIGDRNRITVSVAN